MLTRRLFLAGTALAAPAIVRSESLMKLWVPPKPRFVYDPEVLPFDFSDMQPWKVWIVDEYVAGPQWLPDVLYPDPKRPWGTTAVEWGVSPLKIRKHTRAQKEYNLRLLAKHFGLPA